MKFWLKFALILRKSGILILVINLLSNICEQILTRQMESELSSFEGASIWIWIYGVLSIGLSLITPLLIFIFCMGALLPKNAFATLRDSGSNLLRETIRATGSSIQWALLFILPGLVRFLQLVFVPFVVLLDPAYREGKVNALRASTKIVNSRFFSVLGLILLFNLIIPLATSSLDEFTLFNLHPVSATALCAADALIGIISFLLFLSIWEKSHGTDL